MANRSLNRLSARFIQTAPPGIYEDGGGLRFTRDHHGRRYTLRLTIAGKRCHKGLGSADRVSLAEARAKATELRKAAREGRDAVAERKAIASRAATFQAAFDAYYKVKGPTLSNPKHAAQWRSSMQTYVMPDLGSRDIEDITATDVVAVLSPIWHSKPETAARVLQRIEATFRSAILLGLRKKASPTIGVAEHLGSHERNTGCHAAMPYQQIPEFVADLRLNAALHWSTRLATEFLILTACRSAEVREAIWSEIDVGEKIWTIPANRLKTRRRRKQPHIVPLSYRCLEILEEARAMGKGSQLIFPGVKTGRPLSENTFVKVLRGYQFATATAHGFRSGFKDWCAEVEHVRDEVSEAALAHLVAGRVKAAYLRTNFVAERSGLMARWSKFIAGSHDVETHRTG